MDWSVFLGVLGIIVSIVVGWLTYRLADRRARSNRQISAKATVLQELSKSLGEDSVPAPDILEATIRSVLREVGDPKIGLDVDEILDDLVRQVTSDPFLDSERRRKLQGDIQKVRAEAASKHLEAPREEVEVPSLSHFNSSAWSFLLGLLSSIATLIAFGEFIANRDFFAGDRVLGNYKLVEGIGLVAVGISLLVLVMSPGMLQALTKLFQRRKKR